MGTLLGSYQLHTPQYDIDDNENDDDDIDDHNDDDNDIDDNE